jgi:3-oxoadipate enol-lactonase
MKTLLILTAILIINMKTHAHMQFIKTKIGKIAVYTTERKGDNLPLVFLHGVYFDHHLWDKQVNAIEDRMVIAVDMPLHGESREITKKDWSLSDVAEMLIEILDSLKIPKVVAIGHSWGSMTILRAASNHPERFEGIGLCNMPFLAATPKQKRIFKLQHTMLPFRNFYTKQAAKSLYGKASLMENPDLLKQIQRPMNILTIRDIKETDKKVIINAEDATLLIINLTVKAIALKGKEDYVPTPQKIETVIVEGGHISPLEDPLRVTDFIKILIDTKRE